MPDAPDYITIAVDRGELGKLFSNGRWWPTTDLSQLFRAIEQWRRVANIATALLLFVLGVAVVHVVIYHR